MPTLFGAADMRDRAFRFEDFRAVVHPDDRERVSAGIEEQLRKGVPYDIEYRVVWPDGSAHWLQQRPRQQRRTR